MASERVEVAPEILEWARESIGYSLPAAAKKLGVSLRTLQAWEDGTLPPTINQLRKVSKTFRRPLAVLLLPEPPTDFQPIRDFRTSAASGWERPSPELTAEIWRAESQRDVFLELAEVYPDSLEVHSQLPELSLNEDPEQAASNLRSHVPITVTDQKSAGGPDEALRLWIAAVEASGVLVIHTRGVPFDEARGFSIGEWPYPVIGLNGSDFPRGRLFTLAHELAHVGLRMGGVCDLHEAPPNQRRTSDEVERYCNRVAGALLLPREAMSETVRRARSQTGSLRLQDVTELAREWSVSTEAMLLRLITLGGASWTDYERIRPELTQRYSEALESRRETMRQSSGGPSYYVVKARDLGRSYIATVLEAHSASAISSVDAARYLDVKYNNLSRLAEVASR